MRLNEPGSPITDANRDQYLVFTTVRNHWDICVSWVARRSRLKVPSYHLEAFQRLLGKDNRWLTDDRIYWLHAKFADELVRFENLEADVARVLAMRGLGPVAIAHHNVTKRRNGRPYQEFYDEETKAYIGERFAEEIAELGYAYEGTMMTKRKDVSVKFAGENECGGCGAVAKPHPFVGIARNDTDDGWKPIPVCRACWLDPQHRKVRIKAHFFPIAQKARALRMAGSANLGGGG
jgi:hypothetical protein